MRTLIAALFGTFSWRRIVARTGERVAADVSLMGPVVLRRMLKPRAHAWLVLRVFLGVGVVAALAVFAGERGGLGASEASEAGQAHGGLPRILGLSLAVTFLLSSCMSLAAGAAAGAFVAVGTVLVGTGLGWFQTKGALLPVAIAVFAAVSAATVAQHRVQTRDAALSVVRWLSIACIAFSAASILMLLLSYPVTAGLAAVIDSPARFELQQTLWPGEPAQLAGRVRAMVAAILLLLAVPRHRGFWRHVLEVFLFVSLLRLPFASVAEFHSGWILGIHVIVDFALPFAIGRRLGSSSAGFVAGIAALSWGRWGLAGVVTWSQGSAITFATAVALGLTYPLWMSILLYLPELAWSRALLRRTRAGQGGPSLRWHPALWHETQRLPFSKLDSQLRLEPRGPELDRVVSELRQGHQRSAAAAFEAQERLARLPLSPAQATPAQAPPSRVDAPALGKVSDVATDLGPRVRATRGHPRSRARSVALPSPTLSFVLAALIVLSTKWTQALAERPIGRVVIVAAQAEALAKDPNRVLDDRTRRAVNRAKIKLLLIGDALERHRYFTGQPLGMLSANLIELDKYCYRERLIGSFVEGSFWYSGGREIGAVAAFDDGTSTGIKIVHRRELRTQPGHD